MIAFDRNDSVTLREAATLLPGCPSRATLSRWIHRGIRGVKLRTILIGGRRYVTRDAIEQFVVALSTQQNNSQD